MTDALLCVRDADLAASRGPPSLMVTLSTDCPLPCE